MTCMNQLSHHPHTNRAFEDKWMNAITSIPAHSMFHWVSKSRADPTDTVGCGVT